MAQQQLQQDLVRDARALQMPTFTGTACPNPREWIQQLQLKFTALLVPPERGVRLALSLMAGEAVDWANTLPQQARNQLPDFIEHFLERWVRRDIFSQQASTNEFFSLTQGQLESVGAYAEKLRNLAARLGLPNEQLIQKLWASVKPSIRQVLGLHNRPDTYEGAVSMLEEAERQATATAATSLAMAMQVPQASATQDAILAAISDLGRKMADLTTQRRPQQQDQRGQGRRNVQSRRDVQCFYCKKKGHFQRDCWKAKADNYDRKNQEKEN